MMVFSINRLTIQYSRDIHRDFFTRGGSIIIDEMSEDENYLTLQGASKKSGICFMIIISIKLNTNLVGMYLICKLGSIAPSGVQKHFCTVSGS